MPGKETKRTYQELYDIALEETQSSLEAKELFVFVTGETFARLPVIQKRKAPPEQWEHMKTLLTRRKEGEPLQYLLGEWDFYGLTLSVGEGVLIPRSDTETLVSTGLKLLDGISSPEVLDLCAGSGAIALAVATQRRDATVTAVELSKEAFYYLEKNNQAYDSLVNAVQEDVLLYTHPVPADLILSNPPYIPSLTLPYLQKEVQREPYMALDGGKDGLDFYRFLTQRYASQLKKGGILAYEIGFDQQAAVKKILEVQRFQKIQTVKDLSGHPRVIYGVKQ